MDRRTGILRQAEAESPDQRLGRIGQSVRSLVQVAGRSSGEFRERLSAAGMKADDVRGLEDFDRIPVLRKKDIIRLQAERGLDHLLATDVGNLVRIYQSPGPIFDPEGRGEDYWGWAEAFFAAGFRKGDLTQMTFSYHLTPAGLMLEEPLRVLGCPVIPAGPGNTEAQIELMTRLPVRGFVGMTSYLKTIGEKGREKGLDLKKDFSLEVAFVAAERLTEGLRGEVEAMFGMEIRQGYGTADVGCIAYECHELAGWHVSTRCYVEVCDPATGLPVPVGEVGEVVVTPLTAAYPLIRLATGDLSRLVEGRCACGRTSQRLAGILGRADDTAKVKGQFIYPSQAAEVAALFPAVRAWQIVVRNPGGKDRLAVRVQVEGEFDREGYAREFQAKLKLRPELEILAPGAALPEGAPRLVDERAYG